MGGGGGPGGNRGRSQVFEPFEREGYEKKNVRKRGRLTKK